ncbi:MAG TPA: hypothetical protein VFC92_01840 [Bacteroidales bacterium]|nr:hypothetical protein [Bacteroidales bacterium]HZK23556.1 hypothetical protein [Atopostipes sp.]
MLNLFNKKKKVDPLGQIFSDFTTNQKKSIISLLFIIGICDGKMSNEGSEIQYLKSYFYLLDVRLSEANSYMEAYGNERMVEDLQSLTKSQKELLVVAAWEMITSDGRPNERELQVATSIFEKFGVSKEQFVAIIEKALTLTELYLGK